MVLYPAINEPACIFEKIVRTSRFQGPAQLFFPNEWEPVAGPRARCRSRSGSRRSGTQPEHAMPMSRRLNQQELSDWVIESLGD